MPRWPSRRERFRSRWRQVAASLGHHSFSVTKAHYASAESVSGAVQKGTLDTLLGGDDDAPLSN